MTREQAESLIQSLRAQKTTLRFGRNEFDIALHCHRENDAEVFEFTLVGSTPPPLLGIDKLQEYSEHLQAVVAKCQEMNEKHKAALASLAPFGYLS